MGKIVRIGEEVDGYAVPVLNEREIRASAGLLYLTMSLSYALIIFKGNFLLIKYVITIFLADMAIRVLINPAFSPSLIIGRLIVRNQTPEYVGARQKRFAWTIGLVLSATMFALLVVANTTSPITGIACMMCLTFLFFEAAFGICLGCKFYPLFFKGRAQYCSGEACEAKPRKGIQRTSKAQMLVVLGSIVFLFLAVFLLNGSFSEKPHALFAHLEAEANYKHAPISSPRPKVGVAKATGGEARDNHRASPRTPAPGGTANDDDLGARNPAGLPGAEGTQRVVRWTRRGSVERSDTSHRRCRAGGVMLIRVPRGAFLCGARCAD